jgi:hypothetical protein
MMPFVLAVPALLVGCKALADEEPVQSGKPQVVVMSTVIEGRVGADFLPQGFGPFRPGEKTVLAERKRHGESLSLPWCGEDGPGLILRQAGQNFGVMAFQDKAPTDRD